MNFDTSIHLWLYFSITNTSSILRLFHSINFIYYSAKENKYSAQASSQNLNTQMERLEFMNEVLIYAPRALVG